MSTRIPDITDAEYALARKARTFIRKEDKVQSNCDAEWQALLDAALLFAKAKRNGRVPVAR